jgi:hypothetical protein
MAGGLFGGGNGIQATPYLIEDAQDLRAIHNTLSAGVYKYYRQTANIDLSYYGDSWIPIGKDGSYNYVESFFGEYDGGNFTISNMSIVVGAIDELGLFDTIDGTTNNKCIIKNLNMVNCNISSASAIYCGLLASNIYDTICLNCNIKGDIYGGSSIGGISFYLDSSQVNNCSYEGNISIEQGTYGSYMGGLFGDVDTSILEYCSSNCTMIGFEYVGGLVGYLGSNSTIRKCSSIFNYTSSGYDTDNGYQIGGLIGMFSGTNNIIEESYAIIDFLGDKSGYGDGFGGLIGYINTSLNGTQTIQNCYAIGKIEFITNTLDVSSIGGLIGFVFKVNTGHINLSNSYASVEIILTPSNSYNYGGGIGMITDNSYDNGTITTTNTFYDETVSIVGEGDWIVDNKGTPKTTSQMIYPNSNTTTYTNWDFTQIWNIDNINNQQYPYFQWQTFEEVPLFPPPEDPVYVEPVDPPPAILPNYPIPLLMNKVVMRHDLNLADVAVAPKRELTYTRPTEIYEIHIKDGIASCSIMKYPDTNQIGFIYEFTLGEAKAVSIAFDGRWYLVGNVTRIKTYDKPQIFWVDMDDVLWTQLWDESDTKVALAGDVKQVKAVRGWKSGINTEDDQGLFVAYIRSNDWVYYRSYVQIDEDSYGWSPEERLVEFDGVTENLNVFITNDYKLGVMIESATTGIKRWYISERNYIGTSVPDEYIDVGLTDYTISLSPIMNFVIGDGDYPVDNPSQQGGRYEWEAENIESTITDYKMFVLFGGDTLPVTIENVASVVTQEEFELGSGDNTTTEYETTWYPIVDGSEIVKVNGVTQTIITDYTMDYPNGRVIFNSPPTSGHTILISHNWHSNGHMVKVTFANGIQNATGLQAQCTVVDTVPNNYVVSATNKGVNWADPIPLGRFDGSREFLITTSNFNECVGDLTVNYTLSAGTLQGEAGQDVNSFELTFTPIGLVAPKVTVGAPEVEVIFNE